MKLNCSSWRTRVATPAVLLALAAGLTGCRAGAAVVAAGGSPAAAVSSPAAAATASANASAGAAAQDDGATVGSPAAYGQGSVTASVTSPVTDSGTALVPVSCATGVGYHAKVTSAVVHGDQLSYSVDIPRYTGPGRYSAVVAVTFRQASGLVTAVAGVSRVPVVITTAGGSFTVSATGSGGRTFAGSLRWTCGS
jgi:hypothetical protein